MNEFVSVEENCALKAISCWTCPDCAFPAEIWTLRADRFGGEGELRHRSAVCCFGLLKDADVDEIDCFKHFERMKMIQFQSVQC